MRNRTLAATLLASSTALILGAITRHAPHARRSGRPVRLARLAIREIAELPQAVDPPAAEPSASVAARDQEQPIAPAVPLSEALRTAAEATDPQDRVEALVALGGHSEAGVQESLRRAAWTDPDAEARSAALLALSPHAVRALAVAQNDDDVFTRSAAELAARRISR